MGQIRQISQIAARWRWALAAALLLAVAGTAGAADAQATGATGAARRIVFLPQWVPQAQFAGYYMAQAKGLYAASGLDVEIRRGGQDQPPSAALEQGTADFATMFLATALERRNKGGIPLVNIAQIVQRSSLLLVARKSSGLASPADFNGRKVSVWPEFEVQTKALFRKFNVTPRLIPQGATLNLFLRGGVDAASAMWYNEYHTLINTGVEEKELTVFRYDAFDLNFPEDGIYCRDETLRRDPALCRAFVVASLEGWRQAFAQPEAALDLVMKERTAANLPATRIHQRWMLDRMHDIILPSATGTGSSIRMAGELKTPVMGMLSADDYAVVVCELKTCGIITDAPEYGKFYENLLFTP